MEYSIYVRIATQFMNDNYSGLEVLKKYNPSVEEKLHEYMLKIMLKEYPDDVKKAMKLNKDFCSRFISAQRK